MTYPPSKEGIVDLDDLHERLKKAEEINEQFRTLLKMCTAECKCKKCGEPIYFMKSKNNVFMPITKDGINHFANCPHAKYFKKEK